MADSTDITVSDVSSTYINTVNTDSVEGKFAVLNAINSAVSLKDISGTIDVCDCITMSGLRKGRNGNSDTSCQNTYLITKDGIAYFTQSDGIARSVNLIASLFPDFGKSTKKGCLTLQVAERELTNGNTIKTLVVLK